MLMIPCFFEWKTIQTKNLIWAAGVSAMVFEGISRKPRTVVNEWATDAFNKVWNGEYLR
jgi:NADH dehydrogenase